MKKQIWALLFLSPVTWALNGGDWVFRPVLKPEQKYYSKDVVGTVDNPTLRTLAVLISKYKLPPVSPKSLGQWRKFAREHSKPDFRYKLTKEAFFKTPRIAYVQDIEYKVDQATQMEKRLFVVADGAVLLFSYDDSQSNLQSKVGTPYTDFFKSLVFGKDDSVIQEALSAEPVPSRPSK